MCPVLKLGAMTTLFFHNRILKTKINVEADIKLCDTKCCIHFLISLDLILKYSFPISKHFNFYFSNNSGQHGSTFNYCPSVVPCLARISVSSSSFSLMCHSIHCNFKSTFWSTSSCNLTMTVYAIGIPIREHSKPNVRIITLQYDIL